MKLIRGLHNLRAMAGGCVATIGNFDGVHLGHQSVLGQVADRAAALNLPTVVVIFEPQPREFFSPDDAPARLTPLREKLQALRRFSVDRVLCIPFTSRFAAMSAQQFIARVLLEGLAVRYLVVGDDFRFGSRRQGDYAMLEAAGGQHGFQVARMHTFHVDGARVSSTGVREALAAGDLSRAEKFLGRPYRMAGRVVHGDARGRLLGFPTANVHLHRKRVPLRGVFAVDVFGLDQAPLPAVVNLGTRPTVDGIKTLLEVHLLDFAQNIYGRHLQVDFLYKLRDEQRFAGLDALTAQITRDVAAARDYFAALRR
jgi:riboflavin kinase/FMN adenylyltransferase